MARVFCTRLCAFGRAKTAECGSVLAGAERLLGIKGPLSLKVLQRSANSMTEYPSFDLAGQVALVTGAARGLGRAISLALAHAGADVALGFRDKATGVKLARQIESMGRRALPLQMDVMHLDEDFRALEEPEGFFENL